MTIRRFAAEGVTVRMDLELAGPEARVEIEPTDGRILATHCREPRGAPENPLTRAQLEQKFRTYARARLPEARITEIINVVYGLEALPSARSLMDALRA